MESSQVVLSTLVDDVAALFHSCTFAEDQRAAILCMDLLRKVVLVLVIRVAAHWNTDLWSILHEHCMDIKLRAWFSWTSDTAARNVDECSAWILCWNSIVVSGAEPASEGSPSLFSQTDYPCALACSVRQCDQHERCMSPSSNNCKPLVSPLDCSWRHVFSLFPHRIE